MTLLLALGTLQAIGKARRRRWYEAAASFLGVLGGYLMTVGTIQWHVEQLFWTGAVLVPVGFGLEPGVAGTAAADPGAARIVRPPGRHRGLTARQSR